jgi:hypothetical protein
MIVFPLKKTGKMLSSYPNESIKLSRLWIQTRSGRDKCTLLVYSKGGTVRYRYHTSSRQLTVYYVLQCRILNFTKSIDLSHLNFQDSIIYSYRSFVTLHLLQGQLNEILINFSYKLIPKKYLAGVLTFFQIFVELLLFQIWTKIDSLLSAPVGSLKCLI